MSRPEETSQAVSLASRHNVDMKMSHASTYRIVDNHKGPFGSHFALYCRSQISRLPKQRTDKVTWQIRERVW